MAKMIRSDLLIFNSPPKDNNFYKCNASWEKFQLLKNICGLHPVNKID